MRHFQKVYGRDANIVFRRTGHLGRDLRPTSRCRTQIDDAARALQDLVLLVDLQQLEGGAGAIAFKLGALDVGVIDMTFKPCLLYTSDAADE